jgi:hypothetical protein
MIAISHSYYDIAAGAVGVCSILHTILPPWEFLNDFPRAQKVYKVLIYLVGYIALNARSAVYKTISIQNPDGVNGNGKNGGANAQK